MAAFVTALVSVGGDAGDWGQRGGTCDGAWVAWWVMARHPLLFLLWLLQYPAHLHLHRHRRRPLLSTAALRPLNRVLLDVSSLKKPLMMVMA